MRRVPLMLLLCLLAVGFAACGEKDETGATEAVETRPIDTTSTTTTSVQTSGPDDAKKPSPEQDISRTVSAVLGGSDPAATCSELVTAQYVRLAYGDEQGCRAAVAGQPSFEVTVDLKTLEIDDTLAGVKVKPQGGPNKGETLTVSLERQGNTWKIAKVRSNAPAGP